MIVRWLSGESKEEIMQRLIDKYREKKKDDDAKTHIHNILRDYMGLDPEMVSETEITSTLEDGSVKTFKYVFPRKED